jgi:hypothetical protein
MLILEQNCLFIKIGDSFAFYGTLPDFCVITVLGFRLHDKSRCID